MQTPKQVELPDKLPDTANFLRQVELGSNLTGTIALNRFTRLKEILLSTEGHVQATLNFGNSAGYASVKGAVSASLVVECQRCLQAMQVDIDSRFKFAFVQSEEEFDMVPDEFEPYLIQGDEQSVVDIFEDELLLSVPMVPVHAEACSAIVSAHEQELAKQKEASHPFAALKALKGKTDDTVN